MSEQLLDPAANLLPFRTKLFDLPGELRVRVLRFGERLLGRGEIFQCGFLLLPETDDQRNSLLDAFLKMAERIDFGFLPGCSHLIYLAGAARAVLTWSMISPN